MTIPFYPLYNKFNTNLYSLYTFTKALYLYIGCLGNLKYDWIKSGCNDFIAIISLEIYRVTPERLPGSIDIIYIPKRSKTWPHVYLEPHLIDPIVLIFIYFFILRQKNEKSGLLKIKSIRKKY